MSFKKVSNQIMLITYADSMGKNLKELEALQVCRQVART